MISETSGTTFKLLKNQADSNILPDDVTTVRVGDRFVLLGIRMPEQYITNAENKLEETALAYFTDGNDVELSYPVKLDEKFVTLQGIGDTLDSGKRAKVEDDDLEIANYLTIQNITIAYKEGAVLPTYDMKLANIKSKTLTEEINKSEVNQTNINTFINNNTTNTRVNNNIKINEAGEDLTWQ